MTRIGRILAVAGLLLGFGAAQAQERVVVDRRPSATGEILQNAFGGLLLGSLISGGAILYELEIDDDDDYDWERALAWGGGVGLAAGLLWGIAGVTRGEATYGRAAWPVRDGYSTTLDVRRRDQSHRVTVPLMRGRF